MDAVPAWRKLWQDIVRIDRSQVVFWTALRNAIRVFIPLAGGAATGLLANSHRFAHAVMAIEAELDHKREPPHSAALQTFVADVDTTLAAIALALRDPDQPPAAVPDLRAGQRALGAAAKAAELSYQAAALTAETERITNSLNTILHLLRNPGAEATPAAAQPAPHPEARPG
jgi:hypothetical protein